MSTPFLCRLAMRARGGPGAPGPTAPGLLCIRWQRGLPCARKQTSLRWMTQVHAYGMMLKRSKPTSFDGRLGAAAMAANTADRVALHTASVAGTTSVGLYCSGAATRLEPDPGIVGNWLAASYSDPGTAICGYRQQVDPAGVISDDTALNQVEFACCPTRWVGCRLAVAQCR